MCLHNIIKKIKEYSYLIKHFVLRYFSFFSHLMLNLNLNKYEDCELAKEQDVYCEGYL